MKNITYENHEYEYVSFLPTLKAGHCPKCGGMGFLSKDVCPFCDGTGLAAIETDFELISVDEDDEDL